MTTGFSGWLASAEGTPSETKLKVRSVAPRRIREASGRGLRWMRWAMADCTHERVECVSYPRKGISKRFCSWPNAND